MVKKSTTENKNIYQRTREGLGLTREEVFNLLDTGSTRLSMTLQEYMQAGIIV